MKRLILLVSVVGALFAMAFAAAEGIDINSGALQADTQSDLSCTSEANISWNDDSPFDGVVESVTANVNGDCIGGELSLGIFNTNNCSGGVGALVGYLNPVTIALGTDTYNLDDTLTVDEVEDAKCVQIRILNGTANP